MKYTKKAHIVEAVQFNGSTTHANQIKTWMAGGEPPHPDSIHTRDITICEVELYGAMIKLNPGDWIIKQDGEFAHASDEFFKMVYQKIEVKVEAAKRRNNLSPWYDLKEVMPTPYYEIRNFEFKSHGGNVIQREMTIKDWNKLQLIQEIFSHWRPMNDIEQDHD